MVFEVPANSPTGCTVPLVIRASDSYSNIGNISVGQSGGACSESSVNRIAVHPKAETVGGLDTYRSLNISRRIQPAASESKTAGEAETSSAGERLVEEYSAETHSGDQSGVRVIPGFV